MNKKYVIQAFEMKLKGRFDLLARFYGDYLFQIPAKIIIQQVKDELGIDINEDAIYNLNRRRKNRLVTLQASPLPATSHDAGAPPPPSLNKVIPLPHPNRIGVQSLKMLLNNQKGKMTKDLISLISNNCILSITINN